MIYLDNITSGQTVYIPRNESGANPHKSNSYWEGFEDGYESGETHQKNLLSSVTFTENGEYERENGWSAVTVDVPQTGSTAILEEKTVVISADTTNVTPSSGYDGMSAVTVDASSYAQENYDDGFDDGFVDGYASGSTDEKAKLSAVTFTTNTAVTISDGGYSAITVNVPQTGSSINVEANRYVSTAHSGTLVIHPSSGYSTSVSGTFETGDSRFNTAIRAYNYPSIGTFELVKVVDESDQSKGETVFNLTNGSIVADDTNWSGTPFHPFIQEGPYMTGWFYDANEHYKVVEGADYYYAPFDAMSAVTVDITVPEYNVEVDKSFTATSNGNYVIKASNASTTVTDRFDSDANRYYITATTSGFPLTGRYNLFYIEDEFDSSKGQIDVYIENGYLDYDDSDWYGGEIVDLSVSRNIDLFIRNANRDFGWTPLEDFSHNFDVMSAVSLNVNVQLTNNYENKAATASTNGTMVITPSTIWSVPYTFVTEHYVRYARFVIEGVGPQNYTKPLYRIDWSGYEGYGFLLVKFNANGDELIIDDSSFNTSAYSYTFEYNENEDSYDFVMRNFQTPTPLLTGSTYDAMSAVTLTVNVPQSSAVLREKTITLNGTYSASTDNCDGYSAITVNVPQTGHTDQELEEAFESGHTEGMEDQKALLSSTAFTENGNYSRENGWSGVTVNIDTASTYNSGYTSGYTDGQDNIIGTFSAMTATTNGQYGSSAHPLSAITVEVPQTGTSIPLSSITFTANTSVTVTDKAFTAITVNVPQSGGSSINYIEYIGINNPNRNTCYFELGNTGTGLDSKIVIEHSTLSKENTGSDWESWLMFYDGDRGRIFVENGTAPIQFDGRDNKNSFPYTAITDETIVLEYSGVTVGNSSFNMEYIPYEVSNCNNMVVFAAYGSDFFPSPQNQLKYGRIGTISIYNSAGTLTYKYRPCLDENNVICFHEIVNDVYVYPNNGGDTYLYSGPVINEMYESGYTDGQNSIISTFSSMTATTNGQYGSTAHPMTAITVNVPAPTYLLFAPNKSIGFSDTVMIGNGTRLKMKFKKNNSGYTGNNASIVCAQQHFQTGYIYGGIAIGKNWIGYLAPSASLNIATAFTFTDTPQYEWENYSITASTKGSQIILEVERNGVYTANTFNVSNSFQTSSDAHYFGINYYNATGGDTNYVRLAYDSAESYNISTIAGSDGTLRTGYVFSEIYTFI